jgi:Ca2+/Na+ antiporter
MILLTCVAFNGIISFISHVIFHKSDAKRLGLESANPGFQFEVGFANLAMGLVAAFSIIFHWGVAANIAIILCYALYLLQAIILHLYRFIKREKRDAAYLWGSVVFASLYVANMLFFAIAGLAQEHLGPY